MAGYLIRGLVASLALGGCAEGLLPRDPEPRNQAIGTVRVSTPLFTPLDPFREDRALDFKNLRDEQYLNDRVNQANMSLSTMSSHETATSASISRSKSQTTSPTSSDATAAAPVSEPLPALDPEAVRRVSALLGSSDATYLLAPDEAATIVAALKLYMVSLEDYYNAVAIYNDALRSNPSWVPYRVHFTVTTDPGWFTQLNGYDAVTEVSIGNPDEVQVLTIIPPQNTQAFEQFSAAFRSLSASLSGQATYNKFAARTAIRSLRTAAERLEGLRANTTFTASAYGGNKMRLRFRPSIVPGKRQLELQPLSRIVTAVVLVKPMASAVRAQSHAKCPGSATSSLPVTHWFSRGIRAITTPTEKCLSGGQIEIIHAAWFEAGTSFKSGTRRPPQVFPRHRTLCDTGHESGPCPEITTMTTGYLPRWTPSAVFGSVDLRVHDGIFWAANPPNKLHAAVHFELRVPAPEEGFRLNVQGPGIVRCAETWEELARLETTTPCTGSCLSAAATSFVVYNPRASTFVCELDPQSFGDAEQIPFYVTASSNSVSAGRIGVDYSSVVTKATLHRAQFTRPAPAGARGVGPAPAPREPPPAASERPQPNTPGKAPGP